MKLATQIPLATFATLFLMQGASSQQSSDNQQQGGGAVPIEIYGCSLREGMGLADLEPFHDRYNRFLDRNEVTNVASYILTPVFYHATDGYDLLYMERWENGAAMGRGHALKRSDEYLELIDAWGEALECPTHSYFVGGLVVPPSPDRNEADEAPFQMMSCMLNEGATVGQAFQAIAAMSEAEGPMPSGGRNGHAVWLAAAGDDPDAESNFRWAILFPSYEQFGESFDGLWNEGGAEGMFAAISPAMTCNGGGTRLYNQRYVRRME